MPPTSINCSSGGVDGDNKNVDVVVVSALEDDGGDDFNFLNVLVSLH
jgi:hypothetical protein